MASTAGILLEVFVNPLNLVAPRWPWLSVVFCSGLLAVGGASLLRRTPGAFSLLVAPIALAVIASAFKRYPLHGRLILELVPAFFLLLAEGTERIWQRDPFRLKLAYKSALVLVLAYPCLTSVAEAVNPTIRYFNRHGDLHDNMFLRYQPAQRIPRRVDRVGQAFQPDANWPRCPAVRLESLTYTERRLRGVHLKNRQVDPFAAVRGRLVGAEPDHGPVGRGRGVGQGRPRRR